MSTTETPVTVPLVRPTLPALDELQPLLEGAWASGIVTTGPVTRAFEEAVERKLGVAHAVMVDHGTTALMLAARALGLEGEVIIPPFTWTATAGALVWNGVEPVLADVEPGRFTLDPDAAEAAITPRTTAIMPVNVFGVPPEMDAFAALAERRGLKLLYDSAQGLGARYRDRFQGSFGDAECFSLSPTKVVTALEGGLVTTGEADLADAIWSMRDSGKSADSADIERIGLSGRPSEAHAAVALHSFRRVDELMAAREERIGWYRGILEELPGLRFQEVPASVTSTGNYFVVFVDPADAGIDRDGLRRALARGGIQSKRYFHPPIHLQAAYAHLRDRYRGRLPVAERASARGLALPLYSHMPRDEVERVGAAVRDTLRGRCG